jgi:hypothetical protein
MKTETKQLLDNIFSVIVILLMIFFIAYVVDRSESIINDPCEYVEIASNGKMMCVMNLSIYECECNRYNRIEENYTYG